uniref:BED-type domain-containing protein n=1 Tax=Sinocyclocheilus rhinocerous TaxID=307959 RepID=A0A673GRL3_9TELE
MVEKESEDSESERILLMSKHLKSAVWHFFGFWSVNGEIIDKTNIICKLCKKPLLFHSTTSNMRTHMQSCHPEQFSQECHDEGPALKQFRVTSFYTTNTTNPLPAAKQEEITQKRTEFICKDMRPISIVDGDGFQNFVQALKPRYNLPSRDSTAKSVKASLNNRSVALTTDGWTSLHTDAYVTVTAHFISDGWEIKNYVLKTEELREKHTAENVSECMLQILGEFEIKLESVISVTTDIAGNYVNAVESHMKRVNIPCLAHTPNLAVWKGLRGVRAIKTGISKLKMAAAHFSKSAVDSYLLEKKQKLLEVKYDKLIHDCPTRWNSTYDMIARALEQQAPVAAVIFEVLHQKRVMETWFLTCGKRAPSAPKSHVTFLRLWDESKSESTDVVKQPDARQKTALPAMGNMFDGVCSQTQSNAEQGIRTLEHEMDMYEREAMLPADENPLSWWQKSCGIYPHIAQLAKTYLTIPGTSVRAERMFSSAGNIVNKKRSALAANQVDRLVFLTNSM